MNPEPPRSDAELLRIARQGDREAFGVLVARHQNLVASLAYSICGDFGRSEDLAQETFVSAWKQLGQLQDEGKFRGWVAGIARNLALNFVRRRTRRGDWPPASPVDSPAEVPAEVPDPHHAAVTAEESAVVWGALERLPENYREPLVLFYREEQSIARVAEALEISEAAVKQRLSRGRELLRGEVERIVARSLGCTTLGTMFTASVVGALPIMLFPLAGPAAAGAAIPAAALAPGAAATAKASSVLPFLGAVGGPVLGALGAWLGVKAALADAGSEEERNFIRQTARRIWVIVVLFHVGLFGGLAWRWGQEAGSNSAYVAGLLGWVLAFALGIGGVSWSRARAQAALFPRSREDIGRVRATEFRSRWTFAGLPLVHVRFGPSPETGRSPSVARGWIAIGDIARGRLLAVGGVAVGAVAVGGVAVGILAIGGVSAGLFALGGFSLGAWAFGGAAAAWFTAAGGLAVARDVAWGGWAAAAHGNDAVADAWAVRHHALEIARWLGLLGPLGALFAVIPAWLASRRTRSAP